MTKRQLPSVKKSLSNSGSEAGGNDVSDSAAAADDEVFEEIKAQDTDPPQGYAAEEATIEDHRHHAEEVEEEEEEDEILVVEMRHEEEKSASPETISNATENVLYQEIPMLVRPKRNTPPQSVDDYAEPQLMITSPQPSTHSSITSSCSAAIPISTNGSPLYAQVHKEPRTEIQKIHSTIPNTFKNENLGCMLTTFGTKTPSMTSFGNNSTPMSSLGASGGGGHSAGSRNQLLAASYSNDLNSSKDSVLGSLDMLSDSGNHSDSWMYPQAGGSREVGGRRKARAPPSSFTDQLNQVLADRERCVGVELGCF